MVPSDDQMKDEIKAILQIADPLGVVLKEFVLEVMSGENPNVIRSAADGGRVHGWMIGSGKQENKRQGNPRFQDATIQTSFRIDSTLHYRLWFLHYYQLGVSSTLFQTILDKAVEEFSKRPRFSIEISNIKQHQELQVEDDPDVVGVGDAGMAHFAPCRLVVDCYRTPAD